MSVTSWVTSPTVQGPDWAEPDEINIPSEVINSLPLCAFSRQLALAFRVLVPEDLLPGLLKAGSDRFCSYFIKISWNFHGLMLPRMFDVACV